MKVLFVASGNKTIGTVSAFVQSQYDSLVDEGVQMLLFPIKGKGWMSYLKNTLEIRKLIKKEKPDIVHAHYSYCGYVATIATIFTKAKVFVSILGSFPQHNLKFLVVRFFIKYVWNKTIVKSQKTQYQLKIEIPVIPNGVDLNKFIIYNYFEIRNEFGFKDNEKYVIWASNPSRVEKNFSLAKEAVNLLGDKSVHLVPVFNKTHKEVVRYMCAADVLLLSSNKEGSPNVIKEAMSCNCPIVSTDVGDVRWITQDVEGCFVADENQPNEIANLLKKALSFSKRTQGRKRIIKLGLDSKSVALKIIKLYNQSLTINA